MYFLLFQNRNLLLCECKWLFSSGSPIKALKQNPHYCLQALMEIAITVLHSQKIFSILFFYSVIMRNNLNAK